MHKHLEEYDDQLLQLVFTVWNEQACDQVLVGHGRTIEEVYDYKEVECTGARIGDLELDLNQTERAVAGGRETLDLYERQLRERFNEPGAV